MTLASKLLPALIAGALVVAVTDGASATKVMRPAPPPMTETQQNQTPADGSPWLEGDCHKRMLRGGTWDWSANMVRSGYRENAIVDGGGYSFRVVRTLNVQP